MPSTTRPANADEGTTPGTTASAVLIVAVLAVAAILIIVVLAFSTENTPASVNGRTATTSHHLPEG